jgi:hypothetical protein
MPGFITLATFTSLVFNYLPSFPNLDVRSLPLANFLYALEFAFTLSFFDEVVSRHSRMAALFHPPDKVQ